MLALAFAACVTAGRPRAEVETEVTAALKAYSDAVVAMDTHALGASYTDDGALVQQPAGTRHVGPAAIEAYLRTFSGYRVLENRMRATVTEVDGPRAVQRGTSSQRVVIPSGETVKVEARFVARWLQVGTRWLLTELTTEPEP